MRVISYPMGTHMPVAPVEACGASSTRLVENVAARAFRADIRELRAAGRRSAPTAFARQVAVYLLHTGFRRDLAAIGRAFGRDRSTLAHACRRVELKRDEPKVDFGLACLEAGLARWAEVFLRGGAR